jgi:hypothetical protein
MFVRSCSEGRISIKETLRILKKVEDHISRRVVMRSSLTSIPAKTDRDSFPSFEKMCEDSNANASLRFSEESCGHTMVCLCSLFVSRHQINSTSLDRIMNGSRLFQLFGNSIVFLYSLRLAYQRISNEKFTSLHSNHRHLSYNNCVKHIGRLSSTFGISSLSSSLLQYDHEVKLPCVFFCSMIWIFPEDTTIVSPPIDNPPPIHDHKFTVIKHSNTRYQILQGYLQQQLPINTSYIHPNESPSLQSATLLINGGFGLGEWQRSTITPYSTNAGIDRALMEQFLLTLKQFSTNHNFDSKQFQDMFGVDLLGGKPYWPSFVCRALDDESIIGSGGRELADEIERVIDLAAIKREDDKRGE